VLLTAIIVAICLILFWQAFTVSDNVDPTSTVRTTTRPAEVWPDETTTTGALPGESAASP
jgi:hypothetical protein